MSTISVLTLTSSLKTRACSSQPIRFWTNLKTCNTNTRGFRISKTPEKKGNKWVASPRPRSTPPPGWRGCPGPPVAAYSAAPSTETESCPTDCSELTWTVTDRLPLRTWLNTHTHRISSVIQLMLNTKPGRFLFFPVAKLCEYKRWSIVELEDSLW